MAFSELKRSIKESKINKKTVRKMKSDINYKKEKVILKLTSVQERLMGDMKRIVESFPVYEDIPSFYQELFLCYFSVNGYKHDLSNINWLMHRVEQFSNIYAKKIKCSLDPEEMETFLKQFYGRINSMFSQVSKSFENLESVRRKMKEMPEIKDNLLNVAIFGFPNVGKSTLLGKLTPAKPKIANYAFTTLGINVGYADLGARKIQILDVPGTLNRFEVMNDVEKQAYLVVNKIADIIIYIFDPSETYSLEEQKALYDTITDNSKVMVYCSKTDLVKKGVDKIADLLGGKKAVYMSIEELMPILTKASIKKEIQVLREHQLKNQM